MPQFYAPVTLPANPTNALDAAPKQYVDTKIGIIPTAVKTGNYTAVAGEYVLFDLTSGSYTLTFPSAPLNGTLVGARISTFVAGNTVSMLASGTDVFLRAGLSNQQLGALSMGNQGIIYQYFNGVWQVFSVAMLLGNLNSTYQQLSTVTTKGDLYVGTASATTARQGIGTNGQTLIADSTQTNGLTWGSREIGYASTTTTVGSIQATGVRIVGVAAVPYLAGHKYEITATFRQFGSTVNNDVFVFNIGFGASPGTNLPFSQLSVPMYNSVLGTAGGIVVGRYAPGSNITQDTYLYCARTVGTGIGSLTADANGGPQLIIKDTT